MLEHIRGKKIKLALFALIFATACMPWSSKFHCPKPPLGKCQSIEKTYRETDSVYASEQLENIDQLLHKLEKCKPRDQKCRKDVVEQIREFFSKSQKQIKEARKVASEYDRAHVKAIASLLKEPPVPLRYPPKIVRIYILPYVDAKGNLVMGHYRYFTIDEGKWLLGDYLLEN
ncbi:MAG TPA: type IV conjugative transfer system protein TraV [Candidatus Aenigmarchaeota archaeon]|nr:type IV conjugative transfer system protein TraV [Candidatus Aenigmarchaeota archaeon]